MAFTGNETATTVTARAVVYHQTTVAELIGDGIKLDSDGWKTVTTKKRMNQALEHWGFRDRVWSDKRKGGWFVGGVPFYDGIIVTEKA